MPELALVVGLVLVTSAACSLFEAVLYSVPASRVEGLESAGRPSGRLLKQLRVQVDRPIAAILSLNTIANTGGGALAGAIAVRELGTGNVVYFSAAFTLAILLFSEVLPKTVGVVYSSQVAPWIAHPLRGLVILFRPLIALTRVATRLLLKGHQADRVSDEDLLSLVGSGLRSGSLTQHEASVIRNVLALETRTARDVMTPRPVVFTLATSTTTQQAAGMDELNKHSRVPVFDEDPDDLVGVVHRRDVLSAVAKDRFDLTLDTMMRPIQFVVDSTTLDELLRSFLDRRQHLVAVIDEFGAFTGIVTLEDVLEELIGREIVDEFDQVTDLRAYAHRRRDELLSKRAHENPDV
jgi:CBS domain containing-hemolysin-like protein